MQSQKKYKILVCGGRYYSNKWLVYTYLDTYRVQYEGNLHIIHGNCVRRNNETNELVGADYYAKCWAYDNNISQTPYPAEWKKYGYSAGYVRNKLMLNENPDMVLAFPGGKGTANMVKLARNGKIPVYIVPESRNDNIIFNMLEDDDE